MSSKRSAAYTVGFAAAVCLVCAVLVSSLSVALRPMQDANSGLDRQKNVLLAAGLINPDAVMSPAQAVAIFKEKVREAKTTDGKLLYRIVDKARLEMLVIPIEGKGLWSTIYGFLALDADTTTVRGIAFYKHGETPGLGGEIENPRWQNLWKGRKAYDADWTPAIEVIKGTAGSPDKDPHRVDGLSGATLTSRGVSAFVRRALGDDGYGPYLEALRRGDVQ